MQPQYPTSRLTTSFWHPLWTASLTLSLIITFPFALFTANVPDTSSTAIDFGETVSGAISISGEEDVFTFSASAGDVVLSKMTVTTGDLSPRIRINDSEGDTICSNQSYYWPAEIAHCVLPDSDTYTLRASDCNDGDTGNYQLYLQRLNNPGNVTSMTYGDTLPGSISGAAELDTYTFNVSSGDLLVVQMTETSSDFSPDVRVYDPNGDLLCQADSSYSTSIIGCALPVDGSYTMLAGDSWGQGTGAYNVHIQKLNEPAGAVKLPVAEVKSGTIVAAAEMEAYTLEGSVGDSFIIRANTTSAGGLTPYLRLYDPNGTLVCSDYGSLAEIVNCTVTTAGEHTLLVSDHYCHDVGSYDVHLTRINDPVDDQAIPYAELQVDTTSRAVQLHTYTFTGKENDIVVAQAAVPARTFSPQLRLYREDATLICQDYARTNYGEGAAWVYCILPQDDTYVITVGSYTERGPGTYQLFLQRLTPAVNPSSIRFDTSRASSIVQAGEIDTYTFRAASGDVATVRMSAAINTIDPYIHLYGIDGVILGEDSDSTSYWDGLAEIINCTLPFSGTYTLLVGDCGAGETGDYTLHLECDGDSCGFPLVLDEKVYLPLVIRR